MFRMLAPITSKPPSWKSSPWTAITAVMTSIPAHGPKRMAANAPPSRCPEVPPATGKLIICAAKMKAAMMPIRGTWRSPSERCVRAMAIPTRITVTIQHRIEMPRLRKPSGICMGAGEKSMDQFLSTDWHCGHSPNRVIWFESKR